MRPSSSCFPANIKRCWSGGIPSLSVINGRLVGDSIKEEMMIRTLDFGLDIINGIGRLHLEGDSPTREGFDEDLHLDLVEVKDGQYLGGT